jgi:hypothetical protein
MCRPPEAQSLEQANEVIRFLWNKLIELEDRIHTHSGNSSLPPLVVTPLCRRQLMVPTRRLIKEGNPHRESREALNPGIKAPGVRRIPTITIFVYNPISLHPRVGAAGAVLSTIHNLIAFIWCLICLSSVMS